jgi:hypothetical protein
MTSDPPAAAVEAFTLRVQRSRSVTDLVEDLLGRQTRQRLLGQHEIAAIRPPGLARLRTTGPVLHRQVQLEDSLPPHLPVAALWALIVPWRLPEPVRSALAAGAQPLDRLLDRHAVPWTVEPVESQVHTVSDASTPFPWATPETPLVELTRVVMLPDAGPVAATIDEIPLLPLGLDSGTPLLPRVPPARR